MQFIELYDHNWQPETFVVVTTDREDGHTYFDRILHVYSDRPCIISHHTDGTCLMF